MTMLCTYWPGS